MKGKEESPERGINENEASNVLDIEFKIIVIKMLQLLCKDDKELYGNYKELTGNYICMKKNIETIIKSQEEMKNTTPKMKNTLERIKGRLNEAEDPIRELEDNVEKISQKEKQNEKRLKKNDEGLRELEDNMKYNNIHIIRIPEREEEEHGIENLSEKVMMENFPNLMKEKVTQIQETERERTLGNQ